MTEPTSSAHSRVVGLVQPVPGLRIHGYRVGQFGRTVNIECGKQVVPLHHYCRHSPDGFEWGYGGSGPADLAFSILVFIAPIDVVEQYYQEFKDEVVAHLPHDEFVLELAEVMKWLLEKHRREGNEENHLTV